MIKIPLHPLSCGLFATVSEDKYDLVKDYKWHAVKNGNTVYAMADLNKRPNRKKLYMHRLIMGFTAGDKQYVDHIDHNGLNNQTENLRSCTTRENQGNSLKRLGTSSKYKGVSWHAVHKKWQVHIGSNGKRRYLGKFSSEEEAAIVYNIAASSMFGVYANLNVIV